MENQELFRVYGYRNIYNDAWYVGTTSRKYQSLRTGRNGENYKGCTKFYNAIHEFGWSSFEYHVLGIAYSQDEAYELERYWIEQKNSVETGYNISAGGKGCSVSPDEEWRKHLSESLTGKKRTDETRKRISQRKKGTCVSEETKQKKRETSPLNKPVCQYTLDGQLVAKYNSISEASRQTGVLLPNINQCCLHNPYYHSAGGSIWRFEDDTSDLTYSVDFGAKPILRYTKDGVFIDEFPSIMEAVRQTNIPRVSISGCLRGKSKTAYGFIWKYKEVA